MDILFNNAGIYIIKPLAEIELSDWNRLMSINVTGVFLGMKHIMPLMTKQHNGSHEECIKTITKGGHLYETKR